MDYRKKIKIKLVVIALILSIFAPLLTFRAFAVSTTFDMSAPSTNVKRGDTVVVTVKTKNVSDVQGGFNGFSGTLGYDTSTLTRDKSESKITGWNLVYNAAKNTFLGNDPTGMDFKKTDLDVFTITFKVLDNAPLGETTVKLSKLAVSDSNYANVALGDSTIKLTIGEASKPTPPPEKSDNSNLGSLTTDQGAFKPGFDKNKTDYTIDLPEGSTEITIGGASEDGKAKVSGTGKHNLKEGSNEIVITVTAEDGTKKDYKVTVNVPKAGNPNPNPNPDPEPEPTPEPTPDPGKDDGIVYPENNNSGQGPINITVEGGSSSNNYIVDVQGLGGNLDKPFSKDTFHYTIHVGSEVTKLSPIIVLEDENASYEMIGGDNLQFGLNKVIVRVTAKDGSIKEYFFDVYRSDQVNNTLLSNLQVGGYAFNPGFREDVNYYTLTVGSDVSSLGVSASPKFGGSNVNIVGHDKIAYGVNYIKVSVTGNQTMNTYMVEVIRENEPAKLNLVPWIMTAILSMLVIVLLIVLYFNKKMRQVQYTNTPPVVYSSAPVVAPVSNQHLQNSGINDIINQPGVDGLTREYHFYRNVNENGQTVRKKFKVIEDIDEGV